MRDFTLRSFRGLIEALLRADYKFVPFRDYKRVGFERVVILRHDVDLLPENSLETARLESSLGVRGTYYFRVVKETFKPEIIREIANLGHEVGYHYETIDKVTSDRVTSDKVTSDKVTSDPEKSGRTERAVTSDEEIVDRAYELFCEELEMFRKVVPVETVCMHGSPRGRFDNKMVWGKYDYRELGISGEPYFDVDWNVFGYLTDTGRRWNGEKYSIRDRVDSRFKFDFKGTEDVVRNADKLPDKMMITVHPQRWTDDVYPWVRELVWQNSKNLVKRFLVSR